MRNNKYCLERKTQKHRTFRNEGNSQRKDRKQVRLDCELRLWKVVGKKERRNCPA